MNLNSQNKLIYFLIWRILAVFVVQTSHVPDEYWQSLEVAHKFAFGYGQLTWEWRTRIRSYIYPFSISILYKILKLLQIDYPILLILSPRIFQACLSAYADYRFYKWTKSKSATFMLIINWYWYYCATRTLTNTVETALTTIALSLFPWNNKNDDKIDCKFLWIVGFVCAMRPTMVVPWIPLCAHHILRDIKKFNKLISQYLIIGLVTFGYSIAIDSYCYNKFVLTQWEFFKTNVLNDIADFYGTHNGFWYLTSGLPVLIGLQVLYLPIAIYKVIKNCKINSNEFILIFTVIWTISIYSLIKHKEFRFIMPILPIIIYICACTDNFKFNNTIKLIFILSNLVPMAYFSFVHQSGPLETMRILRNQLTDYGDNQKKYDVDLLFLTPCHAMPLYSHIHKNITIKFLSCEPNLLKIDDYVDEADEFFDNPMSWIDSNYSFENKSLEQLKLPAFVILYDNIVDRLTNFLNYYKLSSRIFNSHFPQKNYGEYIHIYKHESWKYE